MDPVFQNNVILTQTERLTMFSRPKNPKYARNKNVLVIGGSGSGKTRFWLKPNLMQMHSSYVVTDPKGTILVECGKMLQRGAPKLGKDGKPVKDKNGKVIYEPYQIKVLNTINFKKSMHYNPFSYIHSEKDILKLVTTLIANTKGEGKAGDDFWVKAETLLYCALIGYIHYEASVEEQNFSTLIEMINSMEVREDDEEFKNAVDLMFDELKEREPNHFAVRQYAKYKLAAGVVCSKRLLNQAVEKSLRTHKHRCTRGTNEINIEMRDDRAEMSDFPLYLNTVAGGLDCRNQAISGFSFVVKIYALPVVEIIGQFLYLLGRYGFDAQIGYCF